MKLTRPPSLVALALAALALSAPSPAAAADSLGSFRDWRAWQNGSGNSRVCYIASNPKRSEGNYTRRGEVFALVSYRPADKTAGEVSLVAGYKHAADSEVAVRIGAENFSLFTHDEASWARDAETDTRMISAMQAAARMTVEGTSERGTLTRDEYSLLGFTAALAAAAEACGF
ncbi:MAG: invasion associated locus B family protein [Alphaproteobacteria bacterium]|nr:invasion associated locus B family protein [Alphaproteobacteria bacterium]MDA7983901.1 invasion associated locus B family protein [Alphaproteobacteria bacterium]MDA8002351.1 invasion associated locus B family protein [Alphaproteobacteria bacterium]MDA8010442.1 invasion associated locus B family protein [Alphaproteobacteria bacterium]